MILGHGKKIAKVAAWGKLGNFGTIEGRYSYLKNDFIQVSRVLAMLAV